MQTFRTFGTEQDARDYRHKYGTGGWIFASDDKALVILFPPHIPPSNIFHHPFTRGMSGKLIGSA
jgi:hypothetical protein